MSKRAVTVFALLAAVSAEGGVVTFSPAEVFVAPGEPAVFEVTVSSTDLGAFDAVGLDIGSDKAGVNRSFQYAPSFLASTTLPPPPPGCGDWTPPGSCDIFVGGNRLVALTDPTAWRAPLLIGTLSLDTAGIAANSFFDVFVDGARELNEFGTALSAVSTSAGAVEPLQGFARVSVVPEPGTFLMMGLIGAGIVGLRRRDGAHRSQYNPIRPSEERQ